MPAIETSVYQTPSSAYVRRVVAHTALRLWWLILLPLIGFAIAAVVDLRWGFVALIWCSLVAPFILANAYFSRLLTLDARRAVLPQRAAIEPGRQITVSFLDIAEEEEEEREEREEREEPAKPAKEISPEVISWDNIEGIYLSGEYVEVSLRKSPLTALLIPRSALSESDLRQLIEYPL